MHQLNRLIYGCALAALTIVAPMQVIAETNWPEFRGPTGQGHADGANVPLTWSENENIAWKKPIPGSGWSSPIVHRGRIFLTTALVDEGGGPTSLRVICLDADTGGTLFNREVFVPTGEAPKHSKNSHASATPIAERDRLYVHFGHLGTACLTLEGDVVWRQDELRYDPRHGNGGSPIIVDGKLIFSCDANEDPFVVALHKSTGEIAWKTPRITDAAKKFSFSTPLHVTVGGRSVVISPGSGGVMAYDPHSGKEIWRVDYGQGYSVVPRPVLGHGLIYISSGFDSASVYAIRLGGQGDVTDSHVAWTVDTQAPKTPSLLLVGDELYFVSDNGVASCVDAMTGRLNWRERLGGNYSASPLYANGRIYFTSEEGKTVVLRAATQYEELAQNRVDGRVLASLAVVDDALLLRTREHLYRIEN